MSKRDQRAVAAVHQLLRERFPKAFPADYDDLLPLKVGLLADLQRALPEVDPTLLRRALANHVGRDGYLLALLHRRGDRRYDLDGQPVETITDAERAAAQARLDASTARGQARAARVREHQERVEKRRAQRERERRNREAKAARKAAHEIKMQEVAARKAALAARGVAVESRGERKRRLIREAAERARRRGAPEPRPPLQPAPSMADPDRTPSQNSPQSKPPLPTVEFKKKRRFVPPGVE